MKFPAPTPKDHERFCNTEGWTERKRATGTAGTHHTNYEFALPDGNVLWTRISHPVNRTDYRRHLWSHILHDQLHVTEQEFWRCVNDGIQPDRGTAPPASTALPADLVHQLVRIGVAEAEIRTTSKADAIARMTAHWSDNW